MRISKIKITNFRSIKEAEILPTGFNVFVGQNNHGKTNFFEAIDWFFTGPKKGEGLEKIRFGRSGDAEIAVEIEFTEALDGAEKMKNEGNKTKIKQALGENDTVSVRRSSLDPKKRTISIGGVELEKAPTGFDNALNDFLPTFQYVSTQINPLDVAKYGKNTPIANMLSGVLSAILEKDPTYAAFKEQFDKLFTAPGSLVRVELNELSKQVKVYLEKQFPDCLEVAFEVSQPVFEDLLKNFETSIDDGVYTSADEKGDGMQRALMLAIIQTYADFRRENEETSKFFLFFIDEGELHLHPTAQRKLKNALLELSRGGDQIFLNTHSSVLISDETEGQTIFKVEKIKSETSIVPVKEDEKRYIVYELLGGSPADLLLPRNFLIVEGKSEYEFLSRVIARFYVDKPKVQIIYAEGNHERQRQTMEGINKVYVPLFANPVYRDKLIILCDTPSAEAATSFETFKSTYPALTSNGQLIVNPLPSLEEYYPSPWKKTDVEVKAMDADKNAKLLLAREVGSGITQAQFETDMPIVFQALQDCWSKAY
ncbi:MAG: hypothetical protein LiPW15_92 [Parcubacteria group bacterium LiPW_15]|nr:MAG: hypothetical protein LiPW15_92 [Parcubacteria group bacterium LiPW_15]